MNDEKTSEEQLSLDQELDAAKQEKEALDKIIAVLMGLEKGTQVRLLQTVATFLGIWAAHLAGGTPATRTPPPQQPGRLAAGERPFSDREEVSPKQFLLQKAPTLNYERVAGLAYYLTHYRETQFFKTLDITRLNTEAAQPPFSNSHDAVKKATQKGLLVQAGKGRKQISAMGEQYVMALPDRERARAVLQQMGLRRKRKRPAGKQKTSPRKTAGSEQ